MKRILIFLIFMMIIINISANLYHDPVISPNGQFIVFRFNNDLYRVDAEGGTALQLTVNPGYDGNAVISEDGRYIAFTSDRNNVQRKIFVMDIEDKSVRQLTHGSYYDYPLFFEGDELVFQSSYRDYGTFCYSIDIEGSIPSQYFYGPARSMDRRDNTIVYIDGRMSSYRYKYRGSADYDIFIKDMNDNTPVRKLSDNDYQETSPYIRSDNVYFLSARDGYYNIHVKNIDTGREQALTSFDENINAFTIDSEARTIVFEKAFELFAMQAGSEPEKIDIGIMPDRYQSAEELKTIGKVKGFAVSPANDSLLLINAFGEIFAYYPEIVNINITDTIDWDRDAHFIDSTHFYFISNRNGYFDIYLADTTGNVRQVTNTELPEDLELVSDEETGRYDKTLVYTTPEGLYVYEKNRSEKIADGTIHNAVISPHHRYIAYSKMNRDGQSYSVDNIYVYDRKSRQTKRITETGFTAKPVMFSDDCKRLYITYSTNIERLEYYTVMQYIDLIRPESSFKRFPQEMDSITEDRDIDYDGIYDRRHNMGDNDNIILALQSPDRTFIITVEREDNKDRFYKIKTVSQSGVFDYEPEYLFETERITAADISPSGSKIYFISNDRLMAADIGSPPAMYPFSAKINVERQNHFLELYDEAWLVLNDYFYDKEFHGSNWDSIRLMYRPLVEYAEDFSTLSSIIYRMFGDLNASHLSFSRRSNDYLDYSNIGIDYKEDGGYPRITRIYPGGPMDKSNINAREGDYIVSIDGNDMKNTVPEKYLLDKNSKRVKIGLSGRPGGKAELYDIVPDGMWDRYARLYETWVKRRRFLVDSLSNGRIGYIHIRSMGNRDFWKFQDKILFENAGKEGLILDIRNNGGGFSYDYYITFFSRQSHLYKYGRYDDVKQSTPLLTWNKPVAMLINEGSFSNAEMFPSVFKQLGIGTIIGIPTAGGVIGTYNTELFDGTFYRIPALGVYDYEGVNLENNPTEPDIFVDNPPEDVRDNQDSQLKRAVNDLLGQMDEE